MGTFVPPPGLGLLTRKQELLLPHKLDSLGPSSLS